MDAPRTSMFALEMKVEPNSADDQAHMCLALATMAAQDSHFTFCIDPESRETILKGASEDQFDLKLDRLRQEFGVEFNVGVAQVAYRETLAQVAEGDATHDVVRNGVAEFARVKLRVGPMARASGNAFVDAMFGEKLPPDCLSAVEKSVRQIWDQGLLIGFPMVDMKVVLVGVDFDDDNRSPFAFEIATRAAMREGCEAGGVTLLEPITKLLVCTTGEYVGGIIGDIDRRRGQIYSQSMRRERTVIKAWVPVATMFGYRAALLKMTQGTGIYGMKYARLANVPPNFSTDPESDPENFPPAIGMRA